MLERGESLENCKDSFTVQMFNLKTVVNDGGHFADLLFSVLEAEDIAGG
jgi:hypothetical protein